MANFSDLRIIPRRIDIVGPRSKGIDYIGIANSQLKILENEMEIANRGKSELAKIHIGSRTVRLDNGCVVECWTNMNMSGVKITTVGGGEEAVEEKKRCFCTCHVTIGYVQNSRHACYDFIGIDPEKIKYDVLICKKENRYSLLQNVIPMGFTPFFDGQRVLVVFQPEEGKEYVPDTKQGCSMIKARISNVEDLHRRWYEDYR